MSLQQVYEEACCTSTWSDPDPALCGCHGCGWFLSDVDTWHLCPRHNDGQPPSDAPEEDWEAYYAKKAGTFVMPAVEMPAPVECDDDLPF